MSQIKLKHSGGNGVIIAAPSSNPASDRTITLPSDADGTLARTLDVGFKSYAVIADGKVDNSDGGSFTAGAWRTRDLNHEITDEDNIVSISSNQFTLAAGNYLILATTPAIQVKGHQARIYNVTDSAVVVNGMAEFTGAISNGPGNLSRVAGRVSITGSKVFEIQHRCAFTTTGAYAMGTAALGGIDWNSGANGVFYTYCEIYKEP